MGLLDSFPLLGASRVAQRVVDGLSKFWPGDRWKRAVEGRKAPRNLCTRWYKGGGGLNLLLAFNGVCKLYVDVGEGRERRRKGGRNCKGGVDAKIVKIDERVGRKREDKEGEWMVRRREEETQLAAPTQIT